MENPGIQRILSFRQRYTRSVVVSVLSLFLMSVSCRTDGLSPGDSFVVASWNVENLFDAVSDGTEFEGFDPARGGWNERLYHAKLTNTVRVIDELSSEGPAVLALQEIENRRVLSDLWDQLVGHRFRYGFMIDETGGPFHNAVLSRYEIADARVHALSMPWAAPGRLILELDIVLNRELTLVLFVNHWHSRRAGAVETEPSRRLAAALVARRVTARSGEVGTGILVVGDLNANHDDYARASGSYQTALMPVSRIHAYDGRSALFLSGDPAEVHHPDGVVLYSPWKNGAGPGSYVFREEWNTIDHMLFGAGFGADGMLELEEFRVLAEAFMLTASGAPRRWRSDRASGYSDHLPLVARIRLRGD
ncbi:MAG: endonuclease/exonuclease/phosphatase family protein [Spirochaetaceae bacterium]|nr:MAG: endonuclease/exonuclease/phosphatase family protein [Spirochaetaceae bacterium]